MPLGVEVEALESPAATSFSRKPAKLRIVIRAP
jgi:hypothetical protein